MPTLHRKETRVGAQVAALIRTALVRLLVSDWQQLETAHKSDAAITRAEDHIGCTCSKSYACHEKNARAGHRGGCRESWNKCEGVHQAWATARRVGCRRGTESTIMFRHALKHAPRGTHRININDHGGHVRAEVVRQHLSVSCCTQHISKVRALAVLGNRRTSSEAVITERHSAEV